MPRGFGAGAAHAQAAKVAKVSGVEVAAEIVGGIADDPFQSEITRHGGAMDWLVGTGHTAWHDVVSASHHLAGTEAEGDGTSPLPDHAGHGDTSAELHSTIHDHPDHPDHPDHADHHGHVAEPTHDPVGHPPDHPHFG
jgi:hypothetical protein